MPSLTRSARPTRTGPLGIRMIEHLMPSSNVVKKTLCYKGVVLLLTFWTYCCYHATRKTLSIVKTTLYHNCTGLTPPPGIVPNTTWCDWAPFDGDDAMTLLGKLDSVFLISYAIFMFTSGIIAEHVNLRYFLTIGMILSGLANYFFGLAKVYNIHAFSYFFIVQMFGGIAQTTGWPGVVTIMGNWFGKGKRGVIFGVWNSHTSIGNIVGALIASYYLTIDWSLSFIVPGVMMIISGVVVFLFLPETPASVGCSIAPLPENRGINEDRSSRPSGYRKLSNEDRTSEDHSDSAGESDDDTHPIDDNDESLPILQANTQEKQAVGFFTALKIPGVLEFSFSLFFVKLVNYTFLYWLPGYIKSSTNLDAQLSGDLATVFDVGGIIGGITAGIMSDMTGKSATTCAIMLVLSVPSLLFYQMFGSVSLKMNIILLFLVGILVNGPYALITTSVAAELGSHECLQGNSKALATVASIIDGTGSIGAAIGPLITSYLVLYGWEYVFYMLMAACVLSVLLLIRLLINEYQKISRPVPVN